MKKSITLIVITLIVSIACSCTKKESFNMSLTTQTEEITTEQFEVEQKSDEEIYETFTPVSIDQFLEITNSRRQNTIKPKFDTSFIDQWTGAEISSLSFTRSDVEFSQTAVYSWDKVNKDIEILFRWYESMYGPFYFFGGKEVFNNARENILNDLSKVEEIDGVTMENTMLKHLSFINDGHFQINWRTPNSVVCGYICEQGSFEKDSLGFLNMTNGKYVKSINGLFDFEENMVLSLSTDGEITYKYLALWELEENEKPKIIEIEYSDGSTESLELINTIEIAGTAYDENIPVKLEYINDIPIISISAMGFDSAKEDWGANLFLEYAEQMKDEPVLVVDLRGNVGGNGILPQKWYEIYTGEIVPTNYYQIRRYDYYTAANVKEEANKNNPSYIPDGEFEYYSQPVRLNTSWGIQDILPDRVVNNDRILILLVNKNTVSSGDIFTDLAINIENTLVIGTNTAGQLLSNAFIRIKLPNTGLLAQMGNTTNIYSENYFQENTGILPDLWVTGDAKAEALLFIEKYLSY